MDVNYELNDAWNRSTYINPVMELKCGDRGEIPPGTEQIIKYKSEDSAFRYKSKIVVSFGYKISCDIFGYHGLLWSLEGAPQRF